MTDRGRPRLAAAAALCLILATSAAGASEALPPPIQALITAPERSKAEACRNGMIRRAYERWQIERDPKRLASRSAQEVIQSIDEPHLTRTLGCNPGFVFPFLACATADPADPSSKIKPVGKPAETPAAFAGIVKACLAGAPTPVE